MAHPSHPYRHVISSNMSGVASLPASYQKTFRNVYRVIMTAFGWNSAEVS